MKIVESETNFWRAWHCTERESKWAGSCSFGTSPAAHSSFSMAGGGAQWIAESGWKHRYVNSRADVASFPGAQLLSVWE